MQNHSFKELYESMHDKTSTTEIAFKKSKLVGASYSESSGIYISYSKVPSVPLISDYSIHGLKVSWGDEVTFSIQIWTNDRLMPFIASNSNVMKGFEDIFVKAGLTSVKVGQSDGTIHIRANLPKKVTQFQASPIFNKLVVSLSTKAIEKIFKDAFGKDLPSQDLVASILKKTKIKAEHSTKNATRQSPIGQWELTSKNATNDYNKLVAYMDSNFESNSRQGSDTNRTKTYMIGYNRYIAIKQENDLVIVKPYRG